ncbi:MAG: fumarate hydratase [Candidatus Margulisiibacteriota bacterium]
MRIINTKEIESKLVDLIGRTALNVRPDVLAFFKKAYQTEENLIAKDIFGKLIENEKLAKKNKVPYCQDTGLEVIFFEIGQDVKLEGNYIGKVINLAVAKACKKYFLRASVVKDPLKRQNTKNNSPAVIHYEIVPGDQIKISCLVKGFGSENKSKVFMLNPTTLIDDLKQIIIKSVKEVGPDACPPYLIGIGIGGTLDHAVFLSKKACLEKIGKRNSQPHLRKLEDELLLALNNLGIGPLGFGGQFSVMDVKIKMYPTHIAGLPIAIHFACHALRSGGIII